MSDGEMDVTFNNLCRNIEGCALDNFFTVENDTTIAETEREVIKHIERMFNEITTMSSRRFFIGKTYFKFENKDEYKSWWDKQGIREAYRRQKRAGRKYMMVVAIITKKCIPESCKNDRCIIDAEEYALTLKTRLLQHFQTNEKMKNDVNESSGKKKGDSSSKCGYLIYVAYGK